MPIGLLGRPHGVSGELALRPYNAGGRGLLGLERVLVARGAERLSFEVRGLRPVAGGYLIRLAGVDDREAAAALTQAEVRVARSALPPLGDGEYYVEDVPGCAVEDQEGVARGVASATFWNGAHDVLIVAVAGGGERLVPLVPGFVLAVDGRGRKIRVRWDDDD